MTLFILHTATADNNFSRQLLETNKPGKKIQFTLQEDNWVHLKVGKKADKAFKFIDSNGKEYNSIVTNGEGFAELKAGTYTLKGNYGQSIRLRIVPITMFYSMSGVNYNAKETDPVFVTQDSRTSGRPGMFLYKWNWLRKNILGPYNTICGAPSIQENIKWCEEGRNCISGTTSHVENSEDLYELWKKAVGDPACDGVIADEFVVPVITHKKTENGIDEQLGYVSKGVAFLDTTYANIRRFKKDYPNSRFYAWLGVPWDADTADSKPLLDTIVDTDGIIAWEFYANTDGRNAYPMARHDVRTAGFLKARPDFMRHAMLCPGIYEFLDTDSTCDFKVWIDEAVYMFATDQRFKGIRGLGMWVAYYADPEFIRWYTALVRHYCIEGRKEKFSDVHGFKLEPGILANSDYRDGFNGWRIQAAGEDTIKVLKVNQLSFSKGYLPRANQVLSMKYVPGKTNMVSQRLTNLVPGKKYALKANVTSPGITEEAKFAFNIQLTNATIEQSHFRNMKDFLPNRNPQFFNSYKLVFTYNGGDCFLKLSDTKQEGQQQHDELLIDNIIITPYFE